jgi:hypothetical protein
MNTLKIVLLIPFFEKNKKWETSTPECSQTPNHTNTQHNLNTKKTNNNLTKRGRCLLSTFHPNNRVVLRLYKSNGSQKICNLLGDSENLCLPQKIMRVDAIYLTKKQKNKTKNSNFHRVCIQHNTPPHIDPNRSKTYKNNLTTLLSLNKHKHHTLHSISSFINILTVLLRFIIHLFIIIYNLLFIFSLLFIFFIVYIVYYLSCFLEEKNKKFKKWVNPLFTFEKPLFLKNTRRCCYDY